MDHFFAGVYLRRKIRFMAKSQLFGQPVLNYIYRDGGVFPVRRGHHDEEAFMTAHAILDRGGCVLIYAEGGRSRTGELGEAKPGVGRLALESGVPVVPVAIHGSQGVRPWKRLRFPKVTVQYGEPITLRRSPSRPRAAARGGRADLRPVRRCTSDARRRGAARQVAITRPLRSAQRVALLELRRRQLGVVPREDHRLRVWRAEELQLAQRAAPVVAVERARRLGRAVELAVV